LTENFKENLSRIKEELEKYKTILRPDEESPEWWAGAPSVVRTMDKKKFFLAVRMREGKSRRGRRGYEIRILESENGIDFQTIKKIQRSEVELPVFERPCIMQDSNSKKFKLFGCSEFIEGWGIWKLDDADHPADFDPSTLHRVLVPELPTHNFVRIGGYKDPFIFWDGINKIMHMFVIGYDRIERIYHFTSIDGGESWKPFSKQPILDNSGWHNFFTRPACIIPLKIGYILIYEGSNVLWRDPVYNIATGIAYTPNLIDFYDLTPNKPLLKSPTPGNYFTWRYSHWLPINENKEIFVYFECACPDDTNEVRFSKFKF